MNEIQPELELGLEFPQAIEVTVATLVEDIVDGMTVAEWTPYQVSVVVNRALEALGTDYRVRSQMMYNYDRNGMIVRGAKDKKRFEAHEVIAFATRFVEKNQNR